MADSELTDALTAIVDDAFSYAQALPTRAEMSAHIAERVAAAFRRRWLTSMCGDEYCTLHQYLTDEPMERSRPVYELVDVSKGPE